MNVALGRRGLLGFFHSSCVYLSLSRVQLGTGVLVGQEGMIMIEK